MQPRGKTTLFGLSYSDFLFQRIREVWDQRPGAHGAQDIEVWAPGAELAEAVMGGAEVEAAGSKVPAPSRCPKNTAGELQGR